MRGLPVPLFPIQARLGAPSEDFLWNPKHSSAMVLDFCVFRIRNFEVWRFSGGGVAKKVLYVAKEKKKLIERGENTVLKRDECLML